MARIAYPDVADPAIATLVERIKRERGGKLLNLYRMLLHSPPVARGWLDLFTAIRQECELPARVRELAIMRIAVLNRADYEFQSHVPFALAAGLTQAQLDALEAGKLPDGLTATDRAVLAYADAMTHEVRVPDDVFAAVRAAFPERQIVELTATIGGYNLVSRFLEALQVDHEQRGPP
jgi:alkylhydroperoxidase family enzyme